MTRGDGLPRLCVLVLNWNGESDTAACLDSLARQRGATFDILLIDNASPDGSGEQLRTRYPNVHYLQTGTNLGYAGGNNRGMEWALARGAEWIAVLNNDTVADEDCMARLLAAAETSSEVGALSPLITRYDNPARIWFAGGHIDRWRAMGVHEHEEEPVERVLADDSGATDWRAATFLSGCCLLLRARALREVGLFREDFFAYVEDLDLSYRLARAGWALGWVPAARLRHRVPPPGRPPSPWQIVLRDRNRRRLVRDEFTLWWRIAFAVWFWPTRLIHLARYLAARDMPRAHAILDGMRLR